MMRFVAGILLVFLLAVSIFADEVVTDYRLVPQHPRGVERVSNYDPRVQYLGWEDNVYLEPPEKKPIIARGYSERVPAGTARVSSTDYAKRSPNAPQAGITFKVNNLESTRDKYKGSKLYEGWLVDEDTGYWLSIGVFFTDNFGNGRLNTATAPVGTMPQKQKLFHSINFYDAAAVTLEDYPDPDPRPSDSVALYGKIVRRQPFVPEPTTQNKLFGVNKYYPAQYGNPVSQVPLEKREVQPKKYVYDSTLKQWVSR